jgi:hypothetical protein
MATFSTLFDNVRITAQERDLLIDLLDQREIDMCDSISLIAEADDSPLHVKKDLFSKPIQQQIGAKRSKPQGEHGSGKQPQEEPEPSSSVIWNVHDFEGICEQFNCYRGIESRLLRPGA